jgi:alpha-glucosidase
LFSFVIVKRNSEILILLLLVPVLSIFAQKKISLASPDGAIRFVFTANSESPEYAVFFKDRALIEHSVLALSFDDGDFSRGLSIKSSVFSNGEENYSLPAGKASAIHDSYHEVIIPLQERNGKKRIVNIQVRAFNDGLAFRYQFPVQPGRTEYTLTEERTAFRFSGNPVARIGYLRNFTTSHEHRYHLLPVNEIRDDTLIDVPALFEFSGKIYMGITEANLVDYAGMSLIKRKGILQSQLSPLPGQSQIKVKATLPHRSPWRVMMISDRIGALIESNILTDLADPCMIADLSWLKPGKASFHWWNGDNMPDTTFEPGVNFGFNQYYIDFCARNGIEYHTIIGYRGVAWYQNDGVEYQPGPHSDVTIPRPGLDIPQLCAYAKSKGVGIRFWVHWQALYPKLDTAFALFEKWGIKGMMVDFMDRDDQEMVRIQVEILQKAAQHHLEIQFHGAYKGTGLNRTYPNESTREGTLNYENNKGGNLITPDDDINIPFTRGLAGPTDYHLGGFRAVPASRYKVQVTRPQMLGTRCHMLAMYVILENHLSMLCDYPEAYEGQEGFDFLKEVPTVWDETRVPGAEVGAWVTIARRKGAGWWMGTINNGAARTVSIPLGFLEPGKVYHATIYSDAPDVAEEPNHLVKEAKNLRSTDQWTINLPAGGGQVIKFWP